MRTTKMNKFFGIVFALAVALMLGGIALVANCFAVQKSETTAYAEGEDYELIKDGNRYKLILNRDCSFDINNTIDYSKKNYSYSLEIFLNGHTLTVEKSFSTWDSFDLEIYNGTIVYNNNDIMCDNYGILILDNVTFKAKCQCLFTIYECCVAYDSNITVTNCNFIDCEFSGGGGGAFYFSERGEKPITFINNYFYNCSSNSALIYIGNLWSDTRSESHHAQFNMTGCKFYKCKNYRGCIYINAAYIDIGDLNNVGKNSIDSCEASSYAGAIYVGDYHGYGLLKGFVCKNNISKGCYGGAIYLAGDGEVVDNCSFIGNSATENGYGGAIYFEEDYITVQNSYFTENYAYKGGAIYNKGWTNALSNCLFAYNTAKYGWSNDVRLPTYATNCHFYNSSKDGVFDDYWDDYYGYDGYVESSCTVQDSAKFLEFPGAGSVDNPTRIEDERVIFCMYVGVKYGFNPFLAGWKYAITKNNLIWCEAIPNFRGDINGNNSSVYIQGDDNVIAYGGNVKYYIVENHNGINRYDMPNSINYYVFNENSKEFEQKTSDVIYWQNYSSKYAFNSGVYYINRDETCSERLEIWGDVTLVLNSGVTFTAEKGIRVAKGNTLTLANVTTDKNQVGKLVAKGFDGNAAIGGQGGVVRCDGESCGNFYDYGVKVEITSESVGIGGGLGGEIYDEGKRDGHPGGNGGNVKIFGAIATITSIQTGIGGGQGGEFNGANGGNGGNGGTLSLINTDLNINAESYGIGGGRGWWNASGWYSSRFGQDGYGTELYIYNGTTKVKSGYGKAICAYKEGAQHYDEQQFDFIDENPLLVARYGTDENNTNEWGSYKIKEYASANYVEIAEHSHNCTYVANGNTITATCGICDTTASISASISKSFTYDGTAKQVSISNLDNFLEVTGLEKVDVAYYQGTTLLNSAPRNAGSYKVVVSVPNDVKVSLNFEITKKNTNGSVINVSIPTTEYAATFVDLPSIPPGATFGTITNPNTDLYSVERTTNTYMKLTTLSGIQFAGETSFTILVNRNNANYNDYSITIKVRPNGHTHYNWNYVVNGNSITATCGNNGCTEPKYSTSLTLSATGGTYDGTTAFTATCNDNITKFSTITKATLGEIEYYKGTQKLNSAPKDAGTYTAKLTINGTYTIQKEFVVQKLTGSISMSFTETTITYGENILFPLVKSNVGTVVRDKKASDLVNVGTYTVTYTLAETDNYTGDTKTLTVIIEPKEVGLTWSTLTDEQLVYDGTPKILTATATGLVNNDNCDVDVALTTDNDNINAGTFTYKAIGLSNKNYKLPESVTSLEYTITKSNSDNYAKEIDVLLPQLASATKEVALPEIPSGLTFGAITNNNTDLYTVSEITNGKLTLTAQEGIVSATQTSFTILVNGNANYNDYTIKVNVIPSEHTHGNWIYVVNGDTITATCGNDGCVYSVSLTLSALGGTYDGETAFTASHNNTLTMFTNITGATLGEIEYYKGDQKLDSEPINAGTYTAKLTINETYTIQKEFVVQKATYNMLNAKWDYTKAFTYDKKEKIVLVTGLPDGVSVNQYLNNKAINAGEYTASVTLDYDTDNYNEISISDLTWKINKAKVDLPTAIDGLVYSGTEQTGVVLPDGAVYTLNDNKAIGAGNYTAIATLNDKDNYEWNLETPTSDNQSIAWSIAQISLTITAESETITFNEEPSTYTVNVNGFVNEEDFNTYNVDIANYLSCEYEKGKDVGSYDIVLADDESKTLATALKNYALTLVNGTLTVEQKSITGATVVYDESKVYNGDYQTFNVQSVTIDNLLATFAVANNTEKDYSENGYTLTIIASGNFIGTIEKTFAITKAPLTVTIADKESVYGEDLVELTSEITSGTLYGEDNLKIVLTKVEGTNVGDYAITGTYNNANYDVTFVDGTYTITAKDITLEIVDVATGTFTYDGEEKTTTATYTGLVGDDKLSYTLSYSDNINAGTCTVSIQSASITEGTATNYNLITTDTGILVIDKATQSITNISDISKTYDGSAVSEPTYTKLGDGEVTIKYKVKNAEKYLTEAPSNVGNYVVEIIVDEGTNYLTGSQTAEFAITKASLTVIIADKESAYGEDIVELTYTTDGLNLGDKASDLFVLMTTARNSSNVGTYDITGAIGNSLLNKNYTITFVGSNGSKGVYTITKATNEILTLSLASWNYGEPANTPSATAKFGEVEFMYSQDKAQLSFSPTKPTGVGYYIVKAYVVGNDNYDGAYKELKFAINQKAEDVKVKDEDGNEIPNPPASIIGAENGLPPNAVFVVSTISSDNTEKITEVENVLKDMLDNQKVLAVYDAKIMVDNIEKQPNGNITIKMKVPTELLGKNFVIFHIHSESDIQTLDNLNVDADGFITITTNKLSQFAFVVQNEATNSTMAIVILAGAVVVLGGVITTIICVSKRKAKLGK